MTSKISICCLLLGTCLLLTGCSEKAPAPEKAPEAANANAPAAPEKPADKAAEKPAEKPAAAPASQPAGKGKIAANEPGAKPSSMPAANLPATGHFGAAFTLKDSVPLKTVFDASESYAGKTVKVTGKVQSVCKKKGCWLVIQTDEEKARTARITMKDYGFFAPKDCDGKSAIVEGEFSRKLVKEELRKHFAQDGGKDPSKVTGDAEEFTFVANGLEILK